MKLLALGSILLMTSVNASAQAESTRKTEFALFRADPSCTCIRTRKETKTIKAVENRTGTVVYQEFTPRRESAKVLFKVAVGWFEKTELVKWWNYGIADEADFNHDGKPDYSWYGGDDTSDTLLLFLSSLHGYTRVDIYKTLGQAWREKFRSRPPDLAAFDGDFSLSNISLKPTDSGLVLDLWVKDNPLNESVKPSHHFLIAESEFRP